MSNPKQPWADLPPAAPLVRLAEVKKQYGLSNTSLYDMISRGTFPRPIRIGERSVAVPQAWLDAWLESRVFKRHNRHNVLGDAK